jgi:hypothetical protein
LVSVLTNDFRVTGFMDFVHHPEFYTIESTTFRKPDLFPSSGEGRENPILMGHLERANLYLLR